MLYKTTLLTYDPEIAIPYNNAQNRYLHFFSVSLGLELCTTPYAIKLRSDEFYSNLQPFIDAVRETKNKIVTNDIFFRKQKEYPIHPSDHLVGGETELMRSVFSLAKSYCENLENIKDNPFVHFVGDITKTTAEQVLGVSVLTAVMKNKPLDSFKEKELMQSSFEIIHTYKLGFFRIASNSQKVKEYFDHTYFNPETDLNDLTQY